MPTQRGQVIPNGEGKWLLRVYRGRTAAGKREYKAELFVGSEKQARRHLTAMLRQADTGTLPRSSSETLEQHLAGWLAGPAKIRTRPQTLTSYERLVRLYIVPRIGRIKLSKLTRSDVNTLYAELLSAGLSPRTVRYTHAVLRAALNSAEEEGKIVKNPTARATLPALRRAEPRDVGTEAARRFVEAAQNDDLAALWLLMATTGLRPGEALALKWSDIEGPVAHVRRTLVSVGGVPQLDDDLKTERSRRAVPLNDAVLAALRRHRAAQAAEKLRLGEHYEEQGLVFAGPTRKPMDVTAGVRRRLHALLRRAGLPKLRLYDRRHMAATVGMESGVHPRVVADLLGHSTPALTMATYSHVSVGQRELAMQRIGAALFGS